MTKNFRSRLGMRSLRSRRLSSKGMPRFCSSKTRPNSRLIGGGHFGGDHVEAEGQALSGAERAGHHFQGVGQLRGEGLQPPLAAEQQPHRRQRAHQQARQRQQRRVQVRHRGPVRSPAPQQPPEIAANLAIVRRVSACSNSRSMLPNRSRNDWMTPGPVVERLGENAGFLGRAVLGGRRRRRRSARRGGPRSC